MKEQFFGMPIWRENIDFKSYNKKEIIDTITRNYQKNRSRNTWWSNTSNLHHMYNDWDNAEYEVPNWNNSLIGLYKGVLQRFFNSINASLFNFDFDITNYTPFFSSMWVQEFPKSGGGFHNTHIHENDHISGFYYLRCSDKTSVPVFHDPRPGALQSNLPEKNIFNITFASKNFHYKPVPGTLILFNSYIPHEYKLDIGFDDFRFIHFNIQFIRNEVVDYCKGL